LIADLEKNHTIHQWRYTTPCLYAVGADRWDMDKKFMWIGFFLGSSIGGLVPAIWGGDIFSIWGVVLSAVGGIAGLWAGYRVFERI